MKKNIKTRRSRAHYLEDFNDISDVDGDGKDEKNKEGKPVDNTEKEKKSPKQVSKKAKRKEHIIYTFQVYPDTVQMLRNVVYHVKSKGNYKYTQKDALEEAVKLLKKKRLPSV